MARIRLAPDVARAVAKHGHEVDKLARKRYGISGTQLLARLTAGENAGRMGGNPSSAGARGAFQFIPSSRQMMIDQHGVDPWADADQAARAAVIHLKSWGGGGLEGYNPGGGQSYVKYILGQRTSGVPKGSSGGGGGGTTTKTTTTPGVDNSGLRKELAYDYFQQRGKPGALLELATGLKDAGDVPAKTTTTTQHAQASYGSKKGKTNIIALGKLAQSMGLHVGENTAFGGVDPVHVQGSYHYQTAKLKRKASAAIDVSGPVELMQRYAAVVARRYGRDVEELIWRGPGARTRKYGKHVSRDTFSGHQDHVHVADID